MSSKWLKSDYEKNRNCDEPPEMSLHYIISSPFRVNSVIMLYMYLLCYF